MADYTLSAKITGDASSYERAVSSAESATKKFLNRTSKMGSALEKTGTKLTNSITKPALVAGAAMGKLTLWNGFKRLTTIDDAKTKLKALGASAQDVESIMQSCNKAVTGTAYGLDEAGTVAASAMSAGVKAGAEMDAYLKRVANSAGAVGASMTEMGSILNRVQTNGKATNMELQQLSDRGMDVYGMLAKQMGVAKDAVFDLASAGKVSCADLMSALDQLGDSAKVMGTSFTSELANLKASFSRIGANFLDAGGTGGGLFSQLKEDIPYITSMTKRFEAVASTAGASAGKAFSPVSKALQGLSNNFAKLSDQQVAGIAKTVSYGYAFTTALGPAIKQVGQFMASFSQITNVTKSMTNGVKSMFTGMADSIKNIDFSSFAGNFDKIKQKMSGATSGFKVFNSHIADSIKQTNAFQSASTVFDKFKGKAVDAFTTVGAKITAGRSSLAGLSGSVSQFFAGLESKGGALSGFAGQFSKMFGGLEKHFSSSFSAILSNCGSFVSSLVGVVGQIAPAFLSAFNIGAVIGLVVAGLGALQVATQGQITTMVTTLATGITNALTTIGTTLVNAMPNIMAQGVQVVMSLINGITTMLPTVITTAVTIISQLVVGLAQGLPQIIPAGVNCVLTLAESLINNIPQIISAGLQLIVGLAQGIVNAIPLVINKAPVIIQRLVTAFLRALPQMISTGIKLIAAVAKGLIQAMPQAVSMIPRICKGIWNAFKSVNWVQVGLNIIKSVANGLKSMGSAAIQAAHNIGQRIKSALSVTAHVRTIIDKVRGKGKAHGGRVNPQKFAGGGLYSNAYTPILMNESGRGELTMLPNGSYVVPHDLSETYARQASKMLASNGDSNSQGDTIVNMTINGAPGQDVRELADLIEQRLTFKANRRGAVFG